MRLAVLAAEHAAGAVAHAIARGVAERGLFGLQHQIERDAEPAAKLAVAAGVWRGIHAGGNAAESALPRLRCCRISDRRPMCHSPIDDQPSPPDDAPPPGRA